MFDVGGYRVAADISGSGPLVVFVAAVGEPASRWLPVVEQLTEPATTLTYDRGGIGRSDRVPETATPRPYGWFADELAHLLDGIGDPRPAIVVGHSFGCLIARVFARRHPRRVNGLVLAEASQPQLTLWDGDEGFQRDGARPDATAIDVARGAQEVQPLSVPVPAVVLTRTPGRWLSPKATDEVDVRWRNAHAELAGQLQALHLVAVDSGHAITHEAPRLVALAVSAVVRATTQNVQIDPADLEGAGGRPADA